MQYALVDNLRTEPAKNLKGFCPACGKEVIAKCGNIKIHHWAHKRIINCDSWWEPETQWHRDWKNKFPSEFREVIFTEPKSGEIHRADFHTNKGITIEFQNSPISTEELKSRENFYNKLIWIVNGLKFKGGFTFTDNIPNPNDPLLAEFEMVGKGYLKKKEVKSTSNGDLLRVHGNSDPAFKNLRVSNTHFRFTWKNKHNVWFDCNAPIFFDFGHDFIYWLKKREQILAPFWYVEVIKKTDFISKYSN